MKLSSTINTTNHNHSTTCNCSLYSKPTTNVSKRATHMLKHIIEFVKSIFMELGSFLFAAMTYIIPATLFDPSLKKNKSAPTETPILLIHGYLQNSSAWHLFRSRLKKHYHGDIYTVNLGHPLKSIENYNVVVKKKIEEIKQNTGCKEIHLIGHSMGGLVASYHATHEPNIQIKKVITLGSPLEGTSFANIGIGQCARQMEPNHPLTTELCAKIQKTTSTQFMHLGGGGDFIVPAKSAIIGSFMTKNQTRVFDSLGHMSFLYSSDVMSEVVSFIKNDSPKKNTSDTA